MGQVLTEMSIFRFHRPSFGPRSQHPSSVLGMASDRLFLGDRVDFAAFWPFG